MTPIEKAVSYFMSMGWSPAQAAGIVANLHAESGLRPDAVGDGGLAYGIAQWHPDRQQNFAAIIGKSIVGSSLDEQLAFVHAELNGTEKAAGDALRACATASDAGACISKMYERPADREGEAAKRAVLAAKIAGEQPAAPIEDRSTTYQPKRETARMDPLSIIGIFGPVLAQLIPQLGKIFVKPEDTKKQQNLDAITLVLDTITQAALKNPAASGTNVGQVAQAVDAMKADPQLKQEVTKTVLTTPGIMELVEVGGGVTKAREFDIAQQQNQQPFWKASAVFWVSVILLPLVYWLVGSLIVGGVALPEEAPWWVKTVLALFGSAWNGESRSGGFNLVIGLVLGGICGVYFGVSVTQGRNSTGSSTERQP